MNRFQELAARLITKFGVPYNVIGKGTFNGIELNDSRTLKDLGLVVENGKAYVFQEEIVVGDLISINSEDCYVTQSKIKTFKGGQVASFVVVEK